MTRNPDDSIVSPRLAPRIFLVPNREILQRRVAQRLMGQAEGASIIAPPVEMLSVWVEETAVRLRMLCGRKVPASQDALSGLLGWLQAMDSGRDDRMTGGGRAYEMAEARQARAADRLLRQWQEDDNEPWLDSRFYGWRQRVRDRMEAEGVFSAEDWIDDLSQALEGGDDLPLPLPTEIVLDGFVEFTPIERRLLKALEQRGVVVVRGEQEPPAGPTEVREFATPEDEWQAAAQWARVRADAGAKSLCIVLDPSVTASHPAARRVRQTFTAVFHAEAAADLDDGAFRDFHIPAAERLSHGRAVDDAFLLARLSMRGVEHEHDFASISQWLLSPHWAAADGEAAARAKLEWRLRGKGLFRLSLARVSRIARTEGQEPGLDVLLHRVDTLRPAGDASQAGKWIHSALRHWGWPGPEGGAGVTQQAEKLATLLERMAGHSPASLNQGLWLLQAMCRDSVMPFGGGSLSPVQVLAPEVAAAGQFDGIWVCHLDDANWPPPITANPYLPADSRAHIPRMNPDGQRGYYQRLTRMLCAAAPEVRLSWSRDAGQGERNRSGLLEGLISKRSEDPKMIRVATKIWPQSGRATPDVPRLESVEDDTGISFPDEGSVELPGGSDFFRLQAACPLWAYLRHRLSAEYYPMPSPLADPRFRGVLLHRAMRELYARASGDRGLPEKAGIPRAVAVALSGLHVRERLTATGMKAEKGRLERALGDWLELDGGREGFTVEALEEAFTLALGRAAVRVRVDRIDRLTDGRLFLIDYKSSQGGKSRALKWLWPRMQEPQLPLYAVLLESNGEGAVGGMAFAAVKTGDSAFDGISVDHLSACRGVRVAGAGREPVKSLEWGAAMMKWRTQAEALLDEILAGRADNRVYDQDALKYADVALILRHEQAAPAEGGDEADAG